MKFTRLFFISVVVLTLALSIVSAVKPFGVESGGFNVIKSERSPADVATSNEALAGNVTEITVFGFTPTQTWQGYFGNVSGTITLSDANDNVMYNWSLASPEGEIYASRAAAVSWDVVQCFNFTADGTLASDNATAGQTSLHGKNLSTIENEYNIIWDDKDGLNETFSLAGTHESGNGYNHSLFYTNNLQFSPGECLSTHVFGSNAGVNDATFEEVLLYDSVNQELIFTSLLDEENPIGFDNRSHDFEMLVLDDGHGTNTATTTYYFYVELE